MPSLTIEPRNYLPQLSLVATKGIPASNGQTEFKDPAFASNKKLPIHRWVPWIAGFSSEFVRGAIEKYMPKKGVVLDPFAGVGTTLIEAAFAGHHPIGFEINPYAALASRTKLNAFRVNLTDLQNTMGLLEQFSRHRSSNGYKPRSTPPDGFKTRGVFYSPRVLRKVLILFDFIDTIEDKVLQDLFRVAFAATMVSYSNYSYEPSLGQRKSAGRENIEDCPVFQVVLKKLQEMAEDIAVLQSGEGYVIPRGKVFTDTFFNCRKRIVAGSADLIVTSPPYLNNYHYNRNTRPHLYWLGFAERPVDFKPLEEANFGKFWQTAREAKRIDLSFNMTGSQFPKQLKELRKINPEKGIYGGNGWANYAASYFNDCYQFAKCANFSLKKGGTALVVIGNSILQGIMIPTDQYLAEIAKTAGMRLIGIHTPRATRVGSSIIQSDVRVGKTDRSHKLYEAIVELRKI
jgi:DNA modification methylase